MASSFTLITVNGTPDRIDYLPAYILNRTRIKFGQYYMYRRINIDQVTEYLERGVAISAIASIEYENQAEQLK